MNNHELQLLKKLGILITDLEYTRSEPSPYDGSHGTVKGDVITTGSFEIDEDRFRPMCHLIRLVDMICESKNPGVNETFNHLVTMLELTKDNKK